MLRALRGITAFLAGIILAFCLAAAGLWVCCLPITTELLARATASSENPDTPFTQSELVTAALAGRDYTVGSHDLNALLTTLWNLNADHYATSGSAAAQLDALTEQFPALATALAQRGYLPSAKELEEIGELPSADQLQDYFADLDIDQVLDSDAISHLDDVNAVIKAVGIASIVAAILIVALLIYLGLSSGKRWIGGVLLFGGLIVIVAFVAVGLWAVLDFNSMFAALHSVFFAQGNWTFDMDSLLITMYPTGFWIGMGIVWLVVTLSLSFICVGIGAKLRK